ncbi:MAG: hypothetical protein AB8B63_00525 [Granulosicoccus sp.]
MTTAAKTRNSRSSNADTKEKAKKTTDEHLDALEEATLDTLESGREAAINAVDKLADAEAQASDAMRETADKVARFVQEKPLQAAGIAFAAGVVTTLLLRRR